MAKVIGSNISLNSEESSMLGEGKEYELVPNQKGMFILIEKELIKEKETPVKKCSAELDEEKQQVIGLIKKSRLSDLVEGKFEATLNEKQKKALLELVISGKIFVFKLNETYKKGVYRIKEDILNEENREKKESEDYCVPEKQYSNYTLQTDGFLVIRGKEYAWKASSDYERQIKEGLLRGIKSFDGNYYLIQTDLLTAYLNKSIFSFNQKQSQTLDEIAKNTNTSKMLAKIICEFLKDEGELME
ncbi:MAG: hypothetical protein NTY48_07155, partial [Candidatus Diapherotrites archaeon]|nr:hypothetical protein [Candidatus Diapherotrites archaeon]